MIQVGIGEKDLQFSWLRIVFSLFSRLQDASHFSRGGDNVPRYGQKYNFHAEALLLMQAIMVRLIFACSLYCILLINAYSVLVLDYLVFTSMFILSNAAYLYPYLCVWMIS